MVQKKRKAVAQKSGCHCIERSSVDQWQNTCPVRTEHKTIFPADEWFWQPGAAAWVWSVLKAAGGKMPAEELTQNLMHLRKFSRRQAHGLRNRGLTVLEAFDLIDIKRNPTFRGGGVSITYGEVKIIRDQIDKKLARKKKKQAQANRYNKMVKEMLAAFEEQ